MTNEIEKRANQLTEDLKNKSLSTLSSKLKEKLVNAQKFKDKVILCDVSGSMDAYVDNLDSEKHFKAYEVVNHVLENFKGASIWEFSTNCKKTNGQLSMPNGSTALHRAFECMKYNNIKEIILITDGTPDSEDLALREAVGLKINIIYIGPKPIVAFLKKLAQATGGSYDDIELMKLGNKSEKELESKIRGLIES